MGCGTSSLKGGESYDGLNAQPTTYSHNEGAEGTKQPLTQLVTTSSEQTQPATESTTTTPPTDPKTSKLAKKAKPGLYSRYTKSRVGPGEPRDPVTGKGLYTGMTREEIVKYVGGTRGAGIYGYSGGGIGVGGKEREQALAEDVQRAAAMRGEGGDGKARPMALGGGVGMGMFAI